MVKGSMFKSTERMSERETIESFCEGLSKCASAARELAIETDNPEWAMVATTLDSLRVGGKQLANMRSMSRIETMLAAQMKSTPYKPN